MRGLRKNVNISAGGCRKVGRKDFKIMLGEEKMARSYGDRMGEMYTQLGLPKLAEFNY